MNTDNAQLNWKAVRKGRRSARSKNCEAVIGKSAPGKTEHAPIKKRRPLFRYSSPQTWMPSGQDSCPQQLPFSPPFNDDDEILYRSLHSVQRSFRSYSNCKPRRTDSPTMVASGKEFDSDILLKKNVKHNCGENFSGIELLAAAAASLAFDSENASIEDVIVDASSVPINPEASTPTQSKLGSGCFKLDNLTTNEDVTGHSIVSNNTSVTSQDLLGSVENGTKPRSSPFKVDRRHWDLNTVMDAWDEPYNEPVPGNTSNDVDVHVEGRQGGSEDNIVSNSGSNDVEFCNLEVENKLKVESPFGLMLPKVNDTLHVPDNNDYSNVTSETSAQTNEKIVDCPIFVENIGSPVTVEKIELHGSSVGMIESHGSSVGMIESHGSSVGKIESHGASVGKIESPHASVEKIESPHASVEKIALPGASVENIELLAASEEKIDSTVDVHDLDTCLDSEDPMIVRANSTLYQEGYDSPYEDGELRGSFLYSWEDNELDIECVDYESDGRNESGSDVADLNGSEIVDGGSEGSHGSDGKSSVLKRFSSDESNSRGKNKSQKFYIKYNCDNNEIGGKIESNEESVMGENEEAGKRRLTGQRDAVVDKMIQVDEYTPRTDCRDGRSSIGATDGMDVFFMQQCRSQQLGGNDSRSERDACSGKHVSRCRHTHLNERGGVDSWIHWGSRSRPTSTYHGVDRRSHRIKSITGDPVDKVSRLDFQDKRQTGSCFSKGFYGPVARRSSVDQDGCSVVHRKMPIARGQDSYRRRSYSHITGGEFEETFESQNDDSSSTIVCIPPYMSRKERSFSPYGGRGIHTPLTCKRSRSRSRTRSPMARHSHRERNLSTRRQIRSPDYRYEARIDKVRVQFSKSTFASDFGEEEGYMSRTRGCSSPYRGSRWVNGRNFDNCHSKRQRSPVTVFRRTQRFDAASSSSGRLKSDEFFRPTFHPKRFSYPLSGDDRECKFGVNYDRKHDYRGETRRGVRGSDGGKLRRFRRAEVADDFEASNSNNEDAVP